MKLLCIAAASIAVVGVASAERYTVQKAPNVSSTQGKSFTRDVNDSLVRYMLGKCVRDNEAEANEIITGWIQRAKELKNEQERTIFGAYLAKQKAVIDAHLVGIPGRGTYAELKAKYDEERAAYDAAFPKAPPTTGDEAKAAVVGIKDYRTRSDGYVKLYDEMIQESPCVHHGGNWAALAKEGKDAKFRIHRFVQPIVEKLSNQYRGWLPLTASLDKPVPEEYWQHAQHTLEIVDLAIATEKIAPLADQITAWSEFMDGNEKASAAEASTRVAKVTENIGALAAKLLVDVRPPKMPKREDQGKKLRKDAKVLGPIVGLPGNSDQATTEIDKQDGRRYTFNRRHYSTYYVRQPDGGKGPKEFPTLPGVAAKDVCELWHQSFYSYTKGGPSVKPLNKWLYFQDWRFSYMLCKNAKQPTTKKMKK